MSKTIIWSILNIVILLTWIGARPVEVPFILTGQIITVMYFSIFIILPTSCLSSDKLI
jgi:ubiquinol-cytochrome c reductase cytochrome b subunit